MSGTKASLVDRHGLFGDEHDAYRESFRTHLERTVVGDADGWDADATIPIATLRAAAEHGFLAVGVPEEQGGLGLDDIRFAAIVVEESMRALVPALALVLVAHDDVPVRALRAGTPSPRHLTWLEGIASAELVDVSGSSSCSSGAF